MKTLNGKVLKFMHVKYIYIELKVVRQPKLSRG